MRSTFGASTSIMARSACTSSGWSSCNSDSTTIRSIRSRMSVGESLGSAIPLARRSASRRSESIRWSLFALMTTPWMRSLCSSPLSPAPSCSSVWAPPRTDVRGVRSSCDTAVRKVVFNSSRARSRSAALRSFGQGPSLRFRRHVSSQDQHREIGRGGHRHVDHLQHLEAVELRHEEVEENEVGLKLCQQARHPPRVCDSLEVEVPRLQEGTKQELDVGRLVVDHQNPSFSEGGPIYHARSPPFRVSACSACHTTCGSSFL